MRTSRRLFQAFSRLYVELIRISSHCFHFYFLLLHQQPDHPTTRLRYPDQRLGPTGQSVVSFRPVSLLEHFFRNFRLALFEAAYITEIVRSGFNCLNWSTRSGDEYWSESLATVALRCFAAGCSTGNSSLAGQFIILIKDSSIVSLISIQELT